MSPARAVIVLALLVLSPAAAPAADLASLIAPRHVGPPLAEQAVTNRAFSGIPSMAVAPEGRLWATWYAGVTPGEDLNNYVVLSTSADNGGTWREVLVVDPDADGPVRAFDPELWVSPDGQIRIIYDYNRVKDREILLATFREDDAAAGRDVSGAVRLRQVVSKASGGLVRAPQTSP